MLDKAIVQQLQSVVGEENVLTRKVELVAYSYDATADMPHQTPDVVVMPTTSEMVQEVVQIARKHRSPSVCRAWHRG